MITVGYGDTVPVSNLELLFCIVTMLMACGVYAYSLNAIGVIFEQLNSSYKEIKTNISVINNYMDSK